MRLDQIILRGTLAARPAANTLPNGALYATTNTNEVYEVVSQAWVTFVDGDGGGGAPGGADKSSQYNNAGALDGVTVNATATNKYLQQVSSGTPTFEQVAAADVSGLAASATIDATNASNISNGTLSPDRIADGSLDGAKLADETASTLIGRGSAAGDGAPQEISLGANLALTGTVLSAAGGGVNNPGGADKNVQYNDAGAFGGIANNATATSKFVKQVSSGAPTIEQVADADLATTDVTSNDVTTTKHGFAPKAPNDATKFLNGTGAWSVPSGGGGAIWTAGGPSSLLSAPPTTGWSWDNQSGAVVTEPTAYASNSLTLASGVGSGLSVRYRTAPTPPYVITALFHMSGVLGVNYLRFGPLFRQSSDGKLAVLAVRTDSAGNLTSAKFTNATTFSADYTSLTTAQGTLGSRLLWLRIADDNVNRILSYSFNGIDFIQLHSVGRTDFLTADQVGWHIQTEAGAALAVNLLSWVET